MKVLAKRGRGCCSDALAEMGERCIFEVRSELCRKAAKKIKCVHYLKLPGNLRQCIHYFSGSVAAPEVMVDTDPSSREDILSSPFKSLFHPDHILGSGPASVAMGKKKAPPVDLDLSCDELQISTDFRVGFRVGDHAPNQLQGR